MKTHDDFVLQLPIYTYLFIYRCPSCTDDHYEEVAALCTVHAVSLFKTMTDVKVPLENISSFIKEAIPVKSVAELVEIKERMFQSHMLH